MARPEVPSVGLPFLVPHPIGLLDQRKSARFIEAPGRRVALEGPELESIAGLFGNVKEFGTDTTTLGNRKHVELLDPALTECNDPAEHFVVEASPHAACRKTRSR
ncbi:hypothetical protein SAMN05216338_103197 [Bradyrhizobium sp. Rc2d]|nr:hypothetical protein SAMN05216338_103197 [Bradyrhizobium sp. Rc2d]